MFSRSIAPGRYCCNAIRAENFYIVELILRLEVGRKFSKENNRTNIRTTDLMVTSFTIFVETSTFIFIIHQATIDSIILIKIKNYVLRIKADSLNHSLFKTYEAPTCDHEYY